MSNTGNNLKPLNEAAMNLLPLNIQKTIQFFNRFREELKGTNFIDWLNGEEYKELLKNAENGMTQEDQWTLFKTGSKEMENKLKETWDDLNKSKELTRFESSDQRVNSLIEEIRKKGESIQLPKITSKNRLERKLARKLRIARKKLEGEKWQQFLEHPSDLESLDEKYEYNDDLRKLISEQMERSKDKLSQMLEDGHELVTNVKVAVISHETKRREEELKKREERQIKLEVESNDAKKKFNDICNEWCNIRQERDPLNINNATDKQKDECTKLLEQKDGIIETLRNYLTEADELYANDLIKQEEDINTLTDRIDKHINIMKNAYQVELDLLDTQVEEEREDLLERQNNKFNELIGEIHKNEFVAADKKKEIYELHQNLLDTMLEKQQEKMRDTRIKIMDEIHTVTVQTDLLKTTCTLNIQKLHHNNEVLSKRTAENKIIVAQQKRALTAIQAKLSNLKTEGTQIDKTMKLQLTNLNKKLLDVNKNILDMDNRADYFAKNNYEKYRKLWNFNQKQADDLIKNILAAEKIIFEQLLCIKWASPNLKCYKLDDLPSFRKGLLKYKDWVDKADKKNKKVEENCATIIQLNKSLQNVFENIVQQAKFLLDNNLTQLLQSCSSSEKLLINLDSLGIRRIDEFELLLKYFLPYVVCQQCSGKQSNRLDSIEIKNEIEDKSITKTESDNNIINEINKSVDTRLTLVNSLVSEELEFSADDISKSDQDKIKEVDISTDESQNIDSEIDTVSLYIKEQENIPIGNIEEDIPIKLPQNVQMKKYFENILNISGEVQSLTEQNEISEKHSVTSKCCNPNHTLSVDPIYLMKILRNFVNDFHLDENSQKFKSLENIIMKRRVTASREITDEDVKNFWNNYNCVISKEKEEFLDNLVVGLKLYLAALEERFRVNEEIKKLNRSNIDLRRLLERHLNIPENENFNYKLMPRAPTLSPIVTEIIETQK